MITPVHPPDLSLAELLALRDELVELAATLDLGGRYTSASSALTLSHWLGALAAGKERVRGHKTVLPGVKRAG
ncbi:hypothetical protein OpiT1DRAFT_01505 [Opitutaceae bacterium TAV1]|nr:hypothetical protein OpiT1DRAFT_01505 [Opitutaceae bacterium TAV1]